MSDKLRALHEESAHCHGFGNAYSPGLVVCRRRSDGGFDVGSEVCRNCIGQVNSTGHEIPHKIPTDGLL